MLNIMGMYFYQWHRIIQYLLRHIFRFYETWKQIIDMMDADGEQNAYKVNSIQRCLYIDRSTNAILILLQTLGLTPTATQSEITAAFRKLSKENHPDKIKGEAEKKIAQEKFMEISHAYEVLSKIKSKRKQKNKRYNRNERDDL